MNLGIIGAGSLGTALGERLQRAGHAIMFSGGASAKDAAARHGAEVGSNSEAAEFGDVVILAVPFMAINAALADAGPLRSRVLWSCVNALRPARERAQSVGASLSSRWSLFRRPRR